MKSFLRGRWLASLMVVPGLALAALPSQRYGLPIEPTAPAVQTPVLNAEKALAEDAVADKGRPLRYALRHVLSDKAGNLASGAFGRWQDVDADTMLWRTRIDAPGAVSIDLALKPFFLPPGAELWLSDATGKRTRGPYTAADNPRSGEFWTPYVPGDVAYLEVLVPKSVRSDVQLGVLSVQQAYRSIESGDSPYAKSGNCNVDTICPQGDGFRSQINAVARYSFTGYLCTGQLMNDVAGDNKRYFSTANHCISAQAEADSVVLYWKYENPTCRATGTTDNGTFISTSGNSIAQNGGTTLRATYQPADTTLLELNTAVPLAAEPYWVGWDRSENPVASATVIHHPAGHEKRISVENDPLVLSDVNPDPTPTGIPGEKHWKVNDWDVGTTEGGSSGSALLNPQKRLIGVLSGGWALCGNNLADYFGRLSVAWEGGGTPATRVKDWLDPGNTGVTAIDGKGTCTAPTVSLSRVTAQPMTDAAVVLQAAVSGGSGPYTLNWDVDGDGVVDRTVTNAGATTQLSPRYPSRRSMTITATATDATGCVSVPATLALTVSGPNLSAEANGSATQQCGDGDANVEPGELWNVPVRVRNSGEDATNDGFAVFVGGSAGGDPNASAVADSFGYRALSSASSGSCLYQPIDMSAAPALTLTRGPHVNTTTASDEGYVANLSVGGTSPFRFYDQNISTLLMSTNGYLSTNTADGGDDYTIGCGVDSHSGVIDGRIQALHDDLVVQSGGSLRHRHFDACPRPSDIGRATQGCTVFEWRNLGVYLNGGSANGNAVFQTVLYDESYEIVHQYQTALPNNGSTAVVGLQSPNEQTRFDYRCSAANAAPAGTATCFFHPSALPSEAKVHIVSGASAIGDVAGGGSATVTVQAYVDPAASCGSTAAVSYLGTVDDDAYSFAPQKLLNVAMPASGNCQVATQCAAQLPGAGTLPVPGMFFNPVRSGNGQNIFYYGDIVSAAWFTGAAGQMPTWYIVNGNWNPSKAQAPANVSRYTVTSRSPFAVQGVRVGSAQFTRGDDDSAFINTWNLDGVWAGEKLVRVFSPTLVPYPNHSGGWYDPSQSGIGLLIDEHLVNGQPATGLMPYIFDDANQPTWLMGEAMGGSGSMAVHAFRVHCPSCPNFADFATATKVSAGTVTRSYATQTTGTFGAAIAAPAPWSVTWSSAAFPIQMLTPPASTP